MTPTDLTSLDNPRIKAVVRLHTGRERRKHGLFIAQSQREVERAVAAGFVMDELFSCPDLPHGEDAQAEQLAGSAAGRPRWFRVNDRVMQKLSIRQNADGVLATFHMPQRTLADLPDIHNGLWLIAVGIEKPGNLGALARSAAGAGVAGLIVADAVVDVFHPSAIRTSTGAVFTLPIVVADGEAVLAHLQQRGTAMIATSPDGEVVYHQHPMVGDVALIVGPEDTGLDERWMAAAAASPGGAVVRIPMNQQGGVDSLNASVAAAILLFDAARQRVDSAK